METLTQQIKSKAFEIGFSKVGIARAEPLGDDARNLKEWLHRGYQASMSWMEENVQKRIDPREIVPGAKSVIAVAANYNADVQHHPASDEGKISRYAWGDDYHLLITARLQKLFECIKQIAPGSTGRYYVDTGPVMYKVWAERAGLGWRGKHTTLITKDFGSWVFLGEIISTLELEYDDVVEDLCGTCTACIDACPTQAIVEPYVLDSNKCISYLTIEHRGEIDPTFAPHFEQWVYGCDICQDVCPWNKFQQPTKDREFLPREGNVSASLDGLTTLTQEEFSRKFSKSPIKRTKRDGLARNAKYLLDYQQRNRKGS